MNVQQLTNWSLAALLAQYVLFRLLGFASFSKGALASRHAPINLIGAGVSDPARRNDIAANEPGTASNRNHFLLTSNV
jgi:hypothetical protein